MHAAVFLDRDGIIIEDTGHIDDCSRVNFLPRVDEAISLLNKYKFKVLVVTNQAGVAKGYFTEEKLQEINSYIRETLAGKSAFIDGIYYCPHHIEGTVREYKRDCHCRKPNPGMIQQAASDFSIDLNRSFLIGDKMSDIEAGHKAGCRIILVSLSSIEEIKKSNEVVPEEIARDLYGAVQYIIRSSADAG